MASSPNMQERDWNMNKGYYDHVCDLIVQADTASYYNMTESWYKILRTIFRKVEGRLKKSHPEQVKLIDAKFYEIKSQLNAASLNTNSIQARSIIANKQSQCYLDLDQLERDVLELMHEEEMIPARGARTPPGSAVEDFGF